MANSALEGKEFIIPDNIIDSLKEILLYNSNNKNGEGYKRLNFLVNNKKISYYELKRIKNFFDNYEGKIGDSIYNLNGGDVLKNFVNRVLLDNRSSIESNKQIQKDAGVKNAFIKPHTRQSFNTENPLKPKDPFNEGFIKFRDRINEINNKVK